MLRTHSENNPIMTRQHHSNGLNVVAQLRRDGFFNEAKMIMTAIVKKTRIQSGHLWLSHGR